MFLNTKNKEECCGCRACVETCPKACISMKEDEEGFLYPVIDEKQCINCNQCRNVCPMEGTRLYDIQNGYVGVNCDRKIAELSSSGGAFYAIAKRLLEENYIVFGVRYDDEWNVICDEAHTKEEAKKFLKSKYVLSNTNGCYSKVREYLQKGEKVLFSGTPCQVGGLKSFLGKEYENLITIDLVCHGAPHQGIFNKEIDYLEKKYKSKVDIFEFKNKREINGRIHTQSGYIRFLSGKELLIDRSKDPFLCGYYGRLFYRPSCGTCAFAQKKRAGDITLGDAWGAEKVYSDLKPVEGVSLLLCNTAKGQEVYEKIANSMFMRSIKPEQAIEGNEQLRKPTYMHVNRERFFRSYYKKSFSGNVNKCIKGSIFNRAVNRIKRKKVRGSVTNVQK